MSAFAPFPLLLLSSLFTVDRRPLPSKRFEMDQAVYATTLFFTLPDPVRLFSQNVACCVDFPIDSFLDLQISWMPHLALSAHYPTSPKRCDVAHVRIHETLETQSPHAGFGPDLKIQLPRFHLDTVKRSSVAFSLSPFAAFRCTSQFRIVSRSRSTDS